MTVAPSSHEAAPTSDESKVRVPRARSDFAPKRTFEKQVELPLRPISQEIKGPLCSLQSRLSSLNCLKVESMRHPKGSPILRSMVTQKLLIGWRIPASTPEAGHIPGRGKLLCTQEHLMLTSQTFVANDFVVCRPLPKMNRTQKRTAKLRVKGAAH